MTNNKTKKKKFNIIDILAVLAILALAILLALYFGMKSNASRGIKLITGKVDLEIIAEAEDVLDEVAVSAKEGDKLVALKRVQDASLSKVEIINDYEISAIDGKITKSEKTGKKRVRVTISAKANRYGPYFDIGGQKIKTGEPYWIKTVKFNALGNIISVKIKE